jgi:hypothetical protein
LLKDRQARPISLFLDRITGLTRWIVDAKFRLDMKDPIVEQVRSVRKQIEQQYPDAESFYRYLEQQQETYRGRLIRRKPKKPPRAKAS